MNIAVCDDSANETKLICRFLQRHLEKNGFIGNISTFENGEELLEKFTPGSFDIIFLDIYMASINGVETAKLLRKSDPNFALVFITQSRDHAMDAFSVRACAYVSKPIVFEEIQAAFAQCQYIFLKNARFIEVVSLRQKVRIPLIKIIYIETRGHTTLFHTQDEDIGTTNPMTMSKLKFTLGDSFLLCHRSYMVNMNHVKALLKEDFKMSDGSIVPIRQRGRAQVFSEYGEFLSRRLFEV